MVTLGFDNDKYLQTQSAHIRERLAIFEFNSNDHYIYYCGQETLRRN